MRRRGSPKTFGGAIQRMTESIALGAGFEEVARTSVELIERLIPGCRCSITRLSEDRKRLGRCFAPSFPADYRKEVEGAPVGPQAGSCGTALHFGEPVVVCDVREDPAWEGWRDLAERFGIVACWSQPALDGRGEALAAFAIYHSEPRQPKQRERRLARTAAHLLSRGPGEASAAHSSFLPILENGSVTGVFLVARDITRRWRAETALRESERSLNALLGNLPGLAYRCRNDKSWSMELISAGAVALTGYPPESFLSGEVEYGDLIVAEDRQKVWEAVQAAVRLGEAYTLNYGIRTASGERRWVWEQGQGVWDESGELVALEGFITDVTEKRELERQFLRAQRMEGIGRIAGGVAHDLNNALTPIVMTVDLMKRKEEDRGRLDQLAVIESAAARGASMVKQLLSFARGVEGKRKAVSVDALVREVAEIVESAESGSGLGILPCPGGAVLSG